MTKRYKRNEFPKACKDCKYLKVSSVYMDGSMAYSCLNPQSNFLYFSRGFSCKLVRGEQNETHYVE